MVTNTKQTSNSVASLAGKTLQSSTASHIQKQLAASALSQAGTGRQTGAGMEAKASKALSSSSSPTTQKLAGSVVSQSNRKR